MYLQRKIYPERILMTADCIGGVWTYALDLCRELTGLGIEIALAVMGSKLSKDQKNEVKKIPNLYLFESNLKLEWMENPWNDVDKAGKWLTNIQKIFNADVIHLNSYSFGSIKWKVPVIIVAHSDVFSWWNDVKDDIPPPSWNGYYRHVQLGLLNADLIIAPSFYMLSALERNFGLLKNKKVIYNGRDRNLFNNNKKRNFIFASGRIWDEAKDLITLINAAPELKWPVYIAGDNNHPVNGKSFNFSGVNFTGRISQTEISKFLSSASVFIHPAKYEPFGLAPLEAAFSGAALILSGIPSLKEIWKGNALYFKPGDVNSLIEIVNKFILDGDLRNEYAQRAYSYSLNFSSRKMCSEYISVYSDLIMNRNRMKKAGVINEH